jgi:tRNA A-37 threonylcarbamoyl transferase component Bud32
LKTLTSAAVLPSSTEIEGLPLLTENIKFHNWVYITEGTHATIYQAKELEEGALYCVKLFRKRWMTPFNLEKTAYEYMQAAKIERYIPHVYGYGFRTLSEWGIDIPGLDILGDEEVYYGIVMEWITDGEQLSVNNINIDYACSLLKGLAKIHEAGVLHYDTFRRNLMIVPGTRRALWIDFSCAHMNEEYVLAQEIGLAAGVILDLVSP